MTQYKKVFKPKATTNQIQFNPGYLTCDPHYLHWKKKRYFCVREIMGASAEKTSQTHLPIPLDPLSGWVVWWISGTCCADVGSSFRGWKGWIRLAVISRPWDFECCIIGDAIIPSYMGIVIISHGRDPYEPISIVECHKGIERCSDESDLANSSFCSIG